MKSILIDILGSNPEIHPVLFSTYFSAMNTLAGIGNIEVGISVPSKAPILSPSISSSSPLSSEALYQATKSSGKVVIAKVTFEDNEQKPTYLPFSVFPTQKEIENPLDLPLNYNTGTGSPHHVAIQRQITRILQKLVNFMKVFF